MHNVQLLALDIGSTTTKARLFCVDESGGKLIAAADSPTTVEAPEEDVMVGVIKAVESMQRKAPGSLLTEDGEIARGPDAVKMLTASSSAGGGLQVLVTGVWRKMTAESAQRAVLGAGGVVLDVHHVNDGRLSSERVKQIRAARPDMILMTGGTEGGQVSQLVAMAEWLRSADPRPRYGDQSRIPLLYAGNSQALPLVRKALQDSVQLYVCENVRPKPGEENLEPVRDRIQQLFMEHVMSHAPGYTGVLQRVDGPILPTPGAFGIMIKQLAEKLRADVLGVDIGGATTDIFSVIGGKLNRTVSASLGMSYSISNVISSAGEENIARWLPFDVSPGMLREWAVSKMIRPTTLPQTPSDLLVEHAAAREAIRLALQHHRRLVGELKGKRRPPVAGLLKEPTARSELSLPDVEAIIASGGVLSHAGDARRAMGMVVDALSPEGLTRVLLDRGFMMPHLGAIADMDEDAALKLVPQVLVSAGWCLSPTKNDAAPGEVLGDVHLRGEGFSVCQPVRCGEMSMVQLPYGVVIEVSIEDGSRVDWGIREAQATLESRNKGEVLLLDGRKRPVGEHMGNPPRPVQQVSPFGYNAEVLENLRTGGVWGE